MANEKASASKIAKSIEEQYRNKTMSYENAIENLKRINAGYSQEYTAAMTLLVGGKHFSDLTDEQRRAVVVTQENEAAMKRLYIRV
jgi:muramidase (phage lysozyme)